MQRIPALYSKFSRFSQYAIQLFFQKDCSYRAAALAYTFLLALVPLLTVSFNLLLAFPHFSHYAMQFQNYIFTHLVATSAETVQQNFAKFIKKASQSSFTETLSLLVTAVLMVFNIEQTFDAIWETKRQRKWVAGFLLYTAVLLLVPFLIGIGLAVTTVLLSLPLIAKLTGFKISEYLLFLAPYLPTWAGFTFLYAAVPNCKVRLRHAMVGGLVATILFEIAKQGFAFYIKHFPSYQVIYGALAGIVIFLVWIYVCWLVILFGAAVCATFRLNDPNRLPSN